MNENSEEIKVLCAEDEAIIAMAIQEAIDDEPDMQCVGCVFSADSIVGEIGTSKPDVLLLDLTMPGRDPIDALKEVTDKHPGLKTIVFSGYSDDSLVDRAVEAGAWGYVVKSGDLKPLIDAIRNVSQGEFVRPL